MTPPPPPPLPHLTTSSVNSLAILRFADVVTHHTPSILSLAIDGDEGSGSGSGSSGVLTSTVARYVSPDRTLPLTYLQPISNLT